MHKINVNFSTVKNTSWSIIKKIKVPEINVPTEFQNYFWAGLSATGQESVTLRNDIAIKIISRFIGQINNAVKGAKSSDLKTSIARVIKATSTEDMACLQDYFRRLFTKS